MSIIDNTYFINDISLDVGTYSNIDTGIKTYENELIKKLFLYEDATDIIEYNVASDQWVLDVVEGKEFTINEIVYKWVGFKNTDLISALAYYVYYHYLKNITSVTSSVGNIQATVENGQNISFNQKIGAAWIKLNEQLEILKYMLSIEYPAKEFYNNLGSVNMFDL